MTEALVTAPSGRPRRPARRMRLRRAAGDWTIGGPPQPAALVRRDEW